jgi:hypothetical protein
MKNYCAKIEAAETVQILDNYAILLGGVKPASNTTVLQYLVKRSLEPLTYNSSYQAAQNALLELLKDKATAISRHGLKIASKANYEGVKRAYTDFEDCINAHNQNIRKNA